jgi:hypothetical protein
VALILNDAGRFLAHGTGRHEKVQLDEWRANPSRRLECSTQKRTKPMGDFFKDKSLSSTTTMGICTQRSSDEIKWSRIFSCPAPAGPLNAYGTQAKLKPVVEVETSKAQGGFKCPGDVGLVGAPQRTPGEPRERAAPSGSRKTRHRGASESAVPRT